MQRRTATRILIKIPTASLFRERLEGRLKFRRRRSRIDLDGHGRIRNEAKCLVLKTIVECSNVNQRRQRRELHIKSYSFDSPSTRRGSAFDLNAESVARPSVGLETSANTTSHYVGSKVNGDASVNFLSAHPTVAISLVWDGGAFSVTAIQPLCVQSATRVSAVVNSNSNQKAN